jgi:PAS domain S-box-containing protein
MPAAHSTGHWDGDLDLRHLKTGRRVATLAHIFPASIPDPDGEPILAFVARDISERISAEERLRQSEARHRLLVESAYDLIAEFDSKGRFVYASPNFASQLGYPPEELLGTKGRDLIHPQDQELVRVALRNPGQPEASDSPALRVRHHNGGWCWVELNFREYESSAGDPLVLALLRDVTRRKIAEDALRQSQEQLLHSQKMEAIGRLAGGIAHDFNNLLTAITGYGDLLLQQIGDDRQLREDAEEILRAADRAAALTGQLLAFSRRRVLLPKVLNINTLVAKVERLLRRLIGEDIDLVTTLDAEPPFVLLDPAEIEQLVMNLAVNARDAMPQGGQLTIATENVEIPPERDPEHPGIAPGCYVTLVVTDSGVGIPRETLSKIFEPFFTTKDASKGTGLGLAMVYGIVHQSRGEVRVESEPGRGARFTVYLPRAAEEPVVSQVQDPVEDLRGTETILLVEDSDTVRRLVKRSLEQHGYRVIDAASASEALIRASVLDGNIDLLVTDVVLPRMDGHVLAQRLARIRPGFRVVYMSGFSDDVLSRHGVVASDIVLVQKPFAPPVLLREIRRTLSRAIGDPTDSQGRDDRA